MNGAYPVYFHSDKLVLKKGNKRLLRLGQILMQTILAIANFEMFFLQIFFFLMLNKEYVFLVYGIS